MNPLDLVRRFLAALVGITLVSFAGTSAATAKPLTHGVSTTSSSSNGTVLFGLIVVAGCLVLALLVALSVRRPAGPAPSTRRADDETYVVDMPPGSRSTSVPTILTPVAG